MPSKRICLLIILVLISVTIGAGSMWLYLGGGTKYSHEDQETPIEGQVVDEVDAEAELNAVDSYEYELRDLLGSIFDEDYKKYEIAPEMRVVMVEDLITTLLPVIDQYEAIGKSDYTYGDWYASLMLALDPASSSILDDTNAVYVYGVCLHLLVDGDVSAFVDSVPELGYLDVRDHSDLVNLIRHNILIYHNYLSSYQPLKEIPNVPAITMGNIGVMRSQEEWRQRFSRILTSSEYMSVADENVPQSIIAFVNEYVTRFD